MKQLIARFLELLDQPPPADAALLQQLANILDALAHAMSDLPQGLRNTNYPEPPELDQDALRRKISALFPNLGFYPTVVPLMDLSKEMPDVDLDDAIDDILDIANDLAGAQWRFANVGDLDACWNLHFLYRVHWGRHLLNLRSLLHAMLYEKP